MLIGNQFLYSSSQGVDLLLIKEDVSSAGGLPEVRLFILTDALQEVPGMTNAEQKEPRGRRGLDESHLGRCWGAIHGAGESSPGAGLGKGGGAQLGPAEYEVSGTGTPG